MVDQTWAGTAEAVTPLHSLAAWLEHAGYELRRVHAGHYVFRHRQHRRLVTVPAAPTAAAVERVMREVQGGAA